MCESIVEMEGSSVMLRFSEKLTAGFIDLPLVEFHSQSES